MRDFENPEPARLEHATSLAHLDGQDQIARRAVEIAGYTVEDHIESAAHRDPNVTPQSIAESLSEFEIGDDEVPPGDVSPADLRSYIAVLILRLNSLAART